MITYKYNAWAVTNIFEDDIDEIYDDKMRYNLSIITNIMRR